jgi:hypothetical protein
VSLDPLSALTGGLFGGNLSEATSGLLQSQMHRRAAIRKHVTDSLRFESDAANRIYASRFIPLQAEEIADIGPVILVYTLDDSVEDLVAHTPPVFRNILTVAVEIVSSTVLTDQQDPLDAIAQAVEAIVLRDESQGGNAQDTELSGSFFTLSDEGAYPVASLRLEFAVEYHTDAADLVGDELGKINIKWDLAPPDSEIEAEDDVVYEE